MNLVSEHKDLKMLLTELKMTRFNCVKLVKGNWGMNTVTVLGLAKKEVSLPKIVESLQT